MSTDIEAIVQAMRSDLGLGRIDDLELENGQRGQGLRPGQTGMPSGRLPPIANPRNPIPLANRWKAAIQKGEFDDDDAEMVKGLDRIGGGRLHALSSAPSFPPPVRRPPGYGGPMHQQHQQHQQQRHFVTPSMSAAHGPVLPAHGLSRGMVVFPIPVRRSAPPVQFSVPNTSPGVTRPPGQPQPAPTTPTCQIPQKPTVPDPEPQIYFHRAEIEVGDRQAKGRGVIYLVENSGTEADMLYVYLEGSLYLEYPLMSMFNYLTTATQLCLQFREEDGISVTTTALAFGPQDKMVAFMQAVKTLNQKKRKANALSASNQTSATAAGSAGAAGAAAAARTVEAPAKDGSPLTASSAPSAPSGHNTLKMAMPEKDRVSAKPQSTAPATAPATAPEPKPSTVVMTSDLVDLSQPPDTTVPDQHTRSNRLSTYAMDLESLSSSPTQPLSKTSTSGADTHGFRFVPFKPPSTLAATKPKIERIPVPRFNTPINAAEPSETAPKSAKSTKSTKSTKSAGSPQEMLQSYVRTILPVLEAMDEILCIFDADDQEDIMKTVVSRVQASEERANDGKHLSLSSARTLLKTLVSEQQAMPPIDTALTSPVPGPRYTPEDMLCLRQQATTPPQLPSRLDKIPVPTKSRADKSSSSSAVQNDGEVTPTSSTSPERRHSSLRRHAEPFVPGPDWQSAGHFGVWGTEHTGQGADTVVPTVTFPTKGLGASRWAAADHKGSTDSAFSFAGTDSSASQFTFTGDTEAGTDDGLISFVSEMLSDFISAFFVLWEVLKVALILLCLVLAVVGPIIYDPAKLDGFMSLIIFFFCWRIYLACRFVVTCCVGGARCQDWK